MQRFATTICALGLAGAAAGGLAITTALSQPESQQGEMDWEAMEQAWMEANRVTDKHRALEAMVGEWTAEAKFSMGPEESTMEGSMTVEKIFDGRFIRMDFQGEFMGEQFHGVGHMGYDNVRGVYVSSWVDSMSTGIYTDEGYTTPDGKAWVMWGTHKGPTGETIRSKHVTRIESDDRFVMTFHEIYPGQEDMSQTGQITYTRKDG